MSPQPDPPFGDFEVYRSGAIFVLRCKICTQKWTFDKTDLSILIETAQAHRADAS